MPKISQLTELTTLQTGSIIPVVDGLVTKKVTMGTLVGFLNVETGVIPSGTVSSSGQLNDLGAVTTSSLNSLSASISTSIGIISTSMATQDGVSGQINQLSSSISTTTYRISGSSLSTSSFNIYTSSNDTKVNFLINKTGSFATTGSNIFIGNQTINGINFSTSSHIKFVNDGLPASANNDIEIKAGNIRITSSIDNDVSGNIGNAANIGIHISGNVFLTGAFQMGDIFGGYGYFANYGTTSLYGELYSPTLNKFLETSSFNSYTSSIPSISSGSWIPTFVSGNASLNATVSSSMGYYQKIGNIVHFTLNATLTTAAGGGDGTIKFYPPILPSYNFAEGTPVLGRYDEVLGTATVYSINSGGSEAYVYTDTSGSKLITLYALDIPSVQDNTIRVSVSAQYRI